MLGIAPKGLQRAVSVGLTGWAARRTDHVISAGAGWARQFADRWRVPESKITVVENGSEIVELLERERLRCFAEPAEGAAPVRAVYVGSLDPWQGLPAIVSATHAVRAQGVDLRLTIIGDGRDRGAIESAVNELGLRQQVTMAGWLPPAKMAEELAQCEIGVSAYAGRKEFSGLKLLDYKADGLATISSGAGGEPKVLRDGVTGRIVPPGSQSDLTAALLELNSRRRPTAPHGPNCAHRSRRAALLAQHRHAGQPRLGGAGCLGRDSDSMEGVR